MATIFTVFSLGNLADIDTAEGNYVAEDAASLVGSTFGGVGNALLNQAKIFSPGTTGFTGGSSTVYDQDNTPDETFKIDGGPDQTFDSSVVYQATITYVDGSTANISAVIFQDTDGNTYWAPEFSANADQAAMEAAPIRSLKLNTLLGNSYLGMTADRETWDHLICFARDTYILTDQGELQVQHLMVGSKVMTMDNGLQTIRWIGRQRVVADSTFAPVVFETGAIGNSRPLRLSPQHKVLVRDWRAQAMFGENEVLAAAKHFLGNDQVWRDYCGTVEYFHILFDNHEIVFSNGAPTESFHPGEHSAKAIDPDQYNELVTLFPELANNTESYGEAARICLKAHEGKLLAAHVLNQSCR